MLTGKSSCTESGIGSQNIIYIIESFVIGCKVLILHLKGQLVTNLYIMGIIFDFRSCKATEWTLVITQLTIVVKTVFQPGTTLFTKTAFPYLVCRALLDRLTDSICDVRISAVHSKIRRKRIIRIYDYLHFRYCADHLFQNVHGNINFTVAVQLVAEQISQKHVVRLQAWKYMAGRSLVYFNAGVICIQPACRSGSQHKGCYNTV